MWFRLSTTVSLINEPLKYVEGLFTKLKLVKTYTVTVLERRSTRSEKYGVLEVAIDKLSRKMLVI